jgi:transposase-like protein
MMYVRYPLSLWNVEDLWAERGIDLCRETVQFWWNQFGPTFIAEIRRKRGDHMRAYTKWRLHLDKVFIKINGEKHCLWRAVDHEGWRWVEASLSVSRSVSHGMREIVGTPIDVSPEEQAKSACAS